VSENPRSICDYEGSDYQDRFWVRGGREYEHRVEQIALRRLLPSGGRRLLELGAGAGRHSALYQGFEQIVLLDYARSQLEKARERHGESERYIYVVADVYQLPFAPAAFDGATMIRTLHHLSDPNAALQQIREVMAQAGVFILEYANKRNMKAIIRWLARRQSWNPFTHDSVEFAELNFNFHPGKIRTWLAQADFDPRQTLTVSHFRARTLKRILPTSILVTLDGMLQRTGALWQLTPSVFVKAVRGRAVPFQSDRLWRCVECGSLDLNPVSDGFQCQNCNTTWGFRDGIYDFKNPLVT
jgi:ubiquinone/menaquinone biosynthesis C-methylase UbiE